MPALAWRFLRHDRDAERAPRTIAFGNGQPAALAEAYVPVVFTFGSMEASFLNPWPSQQPALQALSNQETLLAKF